MIEGQAGLNWARWKRLAEAAEELGYSGLNRSDHFTGPQGDLKDSLEVWASFTYLATNTKRIKFGALVSPVSWRHPVIAAWSATAIDDLSGGRRIDGGHQFELGIRSDGGTDRPSHPSCCTDHTDSHGASLARRATPDANVPGAQPGHVQQLRITTGV